MTANFVQSGARKCIEVLRLDYCFSLSELRPLDFTFRHARCSTSPVRTRRLISTSKSPCRGAIREPCPGESSVIDHQGSDGAFRQRVRPEPQKLALPVPRPLQIRRSFRAQPQEAGRSTGPTSDFWRPSAPLDWHVFACAGHLRSCDIRTKLFGPVVKKRQRPSARREVEK